MDDQLPMAGSVVEWADRTTLHPLGLLAIVVLGVTTLLVPRRHAVLPMILMACFVSGVQRIVVFTLDFNVLRILVVFGWTRLILLNEFRGFRWKAIDSCLVVWGIASVIAYTILNASMGAMINSLGTAFDAIGMYFYFRCVVRSWDDVVTVVLSFIVVSVPVAIAFIVEKATGRNMFSVFGGVPELTMIRGGRLRCQGAFSHPILAGCFWASVLPMMAGLWWSHRRYRLWVAIGCLNCCAIVLLCGSSTPVVAVLAGCFGIYMLRLRSHLRLVRYGTVCCLVVLHMFMNAPVWHLISRIDFASGSTGWHRYYLIDQFIKHVNEWWLCGTRSTAHWGWGLQDVTNQFILEAVRGGLLRMVLFVLIITLAFRAVGDVCRCSERSRSQLILAWSCGVALFVHCVNYLAVAYFGQIIMVWYLLLGIVASASPARRSVLKCVPENHVKPVWPKGIGDFG